MTDSVDPPPLFDEDESSRKDDEDIFASAVQSPINDEVNSDTEVSSSVTAHPLLFEETDDALKVGQSDTVTNANAGVAGDSTNAVHHDLFESCKDDSVNDSADISSSSINNETLVSQVRGDVDLMRGNVNSGDGLNNAILDLDISDDTSVTADFAGSPQSSNPVTFTSASNTTKCIDSYSKSHFLSETDTTEIALDDSAQEISLNDDDEDEGDMFRSVETGKSHIDQSNFLTRSTVLSNVGDPYSPSQPTVISSYSGSIAASISPSTVSPVNISSPIPSASANSLEQMEKDSGDSFIEILVSDPQKIGEGMGAYMAYKVTTKTNIPYFRKRHWSVTRRFSDFLGLHSKLVEKHLHSGVIIPPAPEKAAIATTKIKLGSDKSSDSSSVEFIERRRAALERYMNRTAAHPKLRSDPDFREFLELDTDLPKATSTSAISSAGVLRLFNKVGETVNKMTFKMDESDQWFEEKTQQIENLDNQLRKLHFSLEGLVGYRRELANSTGSFSKSAAVLSSVEEHTALSRAVHQLSEAMERIHTVHHSQADADFFHLSETTKDYVNIIGAVKEVFHERVKTFQTWQHALATLAKKRENKAKMELTGRIDKVEMANEEVKEWEAKVERSEEEFNRISKAIKVEMEQFDVIRVVDFKDMLIKYLEALITSQLQIVKVWESFLPEAKAIALITN